MRLGARQKIAAPPPKTQMERKQLHKLLTLRRSQRQRPVLSKQVGKDPERPLLRHHLHHEDLSPQRKVTAFDGQIRPLGQVRQGHKVKLHPLRNGVFYLILIFLSAFTINHLSIHQSITRNTRARSFRQMPCLRSAQPRRS